MRGVPWRSVCLALAGGVLVAVALLPDPDPQSLSTWTTDELIAALGHDRTAVQRAVVGQLVARAKTVVPALEAAAPKVDDQQRSGVFEVLEELMLSADAETSELAESALERLTRMADMPVSEGAMHVLISNAILRHARALSNFLDAGGRLPRGKGNRWQRGFDPAMVLPRESQLRILILDDEWTGGDDGLKYLARVYPGESIAVHVTDNAPVSEEALEDLTQRRENLMLRRENESCLGILVDPREDFHAVRISDVVAKSPADHAGLRYGDLLYQFAGVAVTSLDSLKRQTAMYSPEEIVEIRIRRGTRTMRIKLAVGSDFGTGDCRCAADREAELTALTPLPDVP